ncbi:amino acid adenylation domain-containing protein [Kitasatospora sp. NPDC004531]
MTTKRDQDDRPEARGGVSARIAGIARQNPGATALRDGDRQLTFGALDARVARLAARLTTTHGTRPGGRVAVLLERSALHAEAVLAVMRAGATVVLLEPADGAEELARKLGTAAPEAVLTRAGLAPLLGEAGGAAVVLLDEQEDADAAVGEVLEGGVLRWTGGVTGEPGAVLGGAESLATAVFGVVDAYGLGAGDRCAWLGAPAGALGLAEWLAPLAAGATVVVAPEETAGSPGRLRDWLVASGATHVWLDADRADRLLAGRRVGGPELKVLTVWGGGLRRAPRTEPTFTVVGGYGSAETGGPALLTHLAGPVAASGGGGQEGAAARTAGGGVAAFGGASGAGAIPASGEGLAFGGEPGVIPAAGTGVGVGRGAASGAAAAFGGASGSGEVSGEGVVPAFGEGVASGGVAASGGGLASGGVAAFGGASGSGEVSREGVVPAFGEGVASGRGAASGGGLASGGDAAFGGASGSGEVSREGVVPAFGEGVASGRGAASGGGLASGGDAVSGGASGSGEVSREGVLPAFGEGVASGRGAAFGVGSVVFGAVGGLRVYVLDGDGKPVGAGGVGEVFVAGLQGVGYLGDPVRAAGAFVRHGVVGESARLLWRSGDAAVVEADGVVRVLGRVVDRPELNGELVAAVAGSPLWRESAVVGHPATVFVVPVEPGAELPALPGELELVVVPALPRLPDGRVDRRALLALAPRRAPRIVAHPQDAHLPFVLTDTQQAYWIGRSDAVELGNVGCHGYWEWESEGLDVERFRRAWDAVLRQHEMLRAVIAPDGTQRVLAEPPAYEIPVLDLRDASPEEAERRAAELREELSHHVLPADTFPLWDVRLTQLPDGRVRLHLGLDLLIIDAWSYFHILVPDLVAAYEADGAAGALTPLDLTFRDYVLATSGEALEESEDYQRSKAYWLARLDAGLPAAPDLPRAPAGTPSTGLFTRRQHTLSAADWSTLQLRGKAAQLTPSGIVVAAFAEVLRAWSRGDTFTINFPLFNRLPLHPRVDDLIGDFTTTSLLAVEKTDGTFEERARSVQQQLWEDLEHRHFGGVRVMRELARRTDGAVRAAFPVVVTSLLGQPPRHFTTSLGRTVHTSTQTPQVSLDFQVSEVEGRLEFSWDSLDEVFPPGLLEDMFGAYCGLLERLVAEPEAWQREWFDLLPAHQLAVREEANATDGPLPELLLHTSVARHAAERPQALAVVAGERRLTYAELDRRVNQVGRVLRERGARPDQLVAVVLEKGWEQIVAAHGVLASGAAYLPIDPTAPAGRLAALLEDGEVATVLTSARLEATLEWPDFLELLCVERDFENADGSPLEPVQQPSDLAYVIYTSGSTGKPKGVMVAHSGAANTILDINRRYGVGPADSCLAVSGLHFDLSVYDVFGMIEAGGTVVVPAPYDIPDPAAWAELAGREGVTFWNSVPALIEVLVNHLEGLRTAGQDVDGALAALRLVILAGDWIPTTLPDRLRALAPNAAVIGSGGPTESCVWSVLYPIGEVDPDWASIPYGKPMTNQRYHILDAGLRHRPAWVPGEIHIASPVGLARGYWRDEERTAGKFFELPGTGERVYASGDLGRYLPDGNIEILGREDFQVKIQGYRIELGEVEAALADHPQVDRAVVVAAGKNKHSRRLAGFLTAQPGAVIDPAEVQRFAAGTLPAYMVPAALTVLEALPLTGNGKVDRLALTAMASDLGPARDTGFVEPATALETAVGWLWQDLLQAERVGRTDHFFQLGGDSVKATALVGRIRELLGAELSLRTVFAEPTLEGMCAALAADPVHGEQSVAMAEALLSLTAEDLTELTDAE